MTAPVRKTNNHFALAQRSFLRGYVELSAALTFFLYVELWAVMRINVERRFKVQ